MAPVPHPEPDKNETERAPEPRKKGQLDGDENCGISKHKISVHSVSFTKNWTCTEIAIFGSPTVIEIAIFGPSTVIEIAMLLDVVPLSPVIEIAVFGPPTVTQIAAFWRTGF